MGHASGRRSSRCNSYVVGFFADGRYRYGRLEQLIQVEYASMTVRLAVLRWAFRLIVESSGSIWSGGALEGALGPPEMEDVSCLTMESSLGVMTSLRKEGAWFVDQRLNRIPDHLQGSPNQLVRRSM